MLYEHVFLLKIHPNMPLFLSHTVWTIHNTVATILTLCHCFAMAYGRWNYTTSKVKYSWSKLGFPPHIQRLFSQTFFSIHISSISKKQFLNSFSINIMHNQDGRESNFLLTAYREYSHNNTDERDYIIFLPKHRHTHT